MSKQTINIGASPNDGTGTPLRTSFDYTNQNFTELYTALGGGVGLPGATTQVIFNDGGTNLAGDAGLVYNKTTDTLTAGNATITGDLTVDTSTLKVTASTDTVTVGATTTDSKFRVIDANYNGLRIGFLPGTSNYNLYDATVHEFRTANVTPQQLYTFQASSAVWYDGVGGTRMTLNATGLGIGVVPSTHDAGKGLEVGALGNGLWCNNSTFNQLLQNATYNGGWKYAAAASTAASRLEMGGGFSFHIAPAGTAPNAITFTQAMTLDASGNLLVGTPSAVASGSTFQNLGTARQVLTLKGNDETSYTLGLWSATTTGDNFFAYFGTEASTTVRGSVTYNRAGGLVAYNTTSDYRAKDIIGPVSNSGSLIDSLKVYVGKMKGATIERPMLIAHEAQEVAPYSVTGVKDEVDADGKDKYQQMDVSSFVPLLIAEIQSLRARVQTLEAK